MAKTPQELHDLVKDADEETKQKIRDILDGKAKSQLGGTGRDQDGGKERAQFEDDRRRDNEGKDRPPIYKPQDDGERNGYVNRSGRVAMKKTLAPVIDKRSVAQKLRDASSRRH